MRTRIETDKVVSKNQTLGDDSGATLNGLHHYRYITNQNDFTGPVLVDYH